MNLCRNRRDTVLTMMHYFKMAIFPIYPTSATLTMYRIVKICPFKRHFFTANITFPKFYRSHISFLHQGLFELLNSITSTALSSFEAFASEFDFSHDSNLFEFCKIYIFVPAAGFEPATALGCRSAHPYLTGLDRSLIDFATADLPAPLPELFVTIPIRKVLLSSVLVFVNREEYLIYNLWNYRIAVGFD